MDTQIHSALWTLVSSVANTTMGWAMAAAGPVFSVLLAVGIGVIVWKEIFYEPKSEEEHEIFQEEESKENFERFNALHREDTIDPDDD